MSPDLDGGQNLDLSSNKGWGSKENIICPTITVLALCCWVQSASPVSPPFSPISTLFFHNMQEMFRNTVVDASDLTLWGHGFQGHRTSPVMQSFHFLNILQIVKIYLWCFISELNTVNLFSFGKQLPLSWQRPLTPECSVLTYSSQPGVHSDQFPVF